MKSNKPIIFLLLIAILLLAYIAFKPKAVVAPIEEGTNTPVSEVKDIYTYTNHGFSIELPKGFVPAEIKSENNISTDISLSQGVVQYVTNATWWEKNIFKNANYEKDEKIGSTTFKMYSYAGDVFYWFKQGNVGYEFSADVTRKQLETFKFIGWPQVEGNKEDLVSFSIKPGQEVSGKVSFTGSIKGGYFFEGNFGLGVLDANKKDMKVQYDVTKQATSDWMTASPVSFTGTIDFTNLPKGKAYIAITEDDPRDAFERGDDKIKQVFIPIIVK